MAEDSWIAAAYTHARHAEWAGDLDHCAFHLLALEGELGPMLALLRRAGPLEVIRLRAGQLLRRMERLPDAARPGPESMVETAHFRGVIRRLGTREFELRAYLTDFDYEETFWMRAEALIRDRRQLDEKLAAREPRRMAGGDVAERNAQLPDLLAEVQGEEEDDDPLRGWWELNGGLVIQVTVSEFALLRIRGEWVQAGAPQDFGRVREGLESVLRRFESEGGDAFA